MQTNATLSIGRDAINQMLIEMQQSNKQILEILHEEQLANAQRMKEFHKMFSDGMTKLIDSLSDLSDDPDPVETSNIQADEAEAEIATEEEAMNEDDGVQETKTTTNVGSVCNKLTALEVPLNGNADMWKKSTDQGMLSELQDILPGIINQLGPDNLDNLRLLAEQFKKRAPGMPAQEPIPEEDDDDEVPNLVEGETYEAAAAEEAKS